MQFQTARPDVIRAINQRWLFRYWDESRGRQALPTWQELEGREFAAMSKNLCFLDVVREAGNVRFLMRFHSAWLGEVYGFDCHDKFLDQMRSGEFQDALLGMYQQVVATRTPVFASVDITDREGRIVHYERLLLPFGRDRNTVDRILTSLEMVSPDGAFDHRNLMAVAKTPSSFAVCATIPPP